MPDLSALIERLEKATGPDRELDAALMVARCGARRVDEFNFYGPNEEHWSFGEHEEESGAWNGPLPRLTASIDAALAFVERVLPDHSVEMGHYKDEEGPTGPCARVSTYCLGDGPRWEDDRSQHPTSLCFAILIAALKALQERGEV